MVVRSFTARTVSLLAALSLLLPLGVAEQQQQQVLGAGDGERYGGGGGGEELPMPQATVFSTDPLVVYIRDFLSGAEIAELVSILDASMYHDSQILTSDNDQGTNPSVRRSRSANILRSLPISQVITERALAFQGLHGVDSDRRVETLQVVAYEPGGFFTYHFDWFGETRPYEERLSSFFVYLDDACDGGGTHFPNLQDVPKKGGYCELVECEEERENGGDGEGEMEGEIEEHGHDGRGVVFRPRKGAAVFWKNVRENGEGHEGTLHKGMEVLAGTKLGLNIWTKIYDQDPAYFMSQGAGGYAG